jgi:hypothetical protein
VDATANDNGCEREVFRAARLERLRAQSAAIVQACGSHGRESFVNHRMAGSDRCSSCVGRSHPIIG